MALIMPGVSAVHRVHATVRLEDQRHAALTTPAAMLVPLRRMDLLP